MPITVDIDVLLARRKMSVGELAERLSRGQRKHWLVPRRSDHEDPHPADGHGRSLATRITPGQAADSRQLIPLLGQVWVPRPDGVGRPRKRPDSVTGDMAYSSRANRRALRNKGITTVVPEPNDQIANRKRRGRRGGHPPTFDTTAYKRRNQVSNAASPGANTGAASLPGTTNSPPTAGPLSTWSKPSTGYAPSPTNKIHQTRLTGSGLP